MTGLTKTKIKITPLETRLMLDASLGGLVSSIVFAENTVNAGEQSLDTDVTITGTTTDFSSETLTISTTAGAQEQLTINDEGTGTGQIGFDGTNVSFSGTTIGTLNSNGVNGSDLAIALNANASKASIERLIENVTYQNTSDTPTLNRTINVSLGALFSENIDVTIVEQNDAPTLNVNNGISLNEATQTTITTSNINVIDADNPNSDLVINVTNTPTNGQLELTTNSGVAITAFTMNDIINNRVIYIHNGSETTTDSFDFTATDGDATLTSETFDITINAINDPLTLDTNTGVTVFQNLSTTIGGETLQFGEEVLRYNATGQYDTWEGFIDDKSLQYSLIFTTPSDAPNATPGEVLFESGGSGQGIGLFLNSSYELGFYAGNASNTPRLSSDALLAGTQYAVVIEIDQTTDEIRMHYQQVGNFNWFAFGRSAEKSLSNYTSTNHSGSNESGIGQVGGNSYGGYNGSVSGTTAFQGTIDSDVLVSDFPIRSGTPNQTLVANDFDTNADNIIYTITNNTSNGTISLGGVALGLNDTFTQSDLDIGLITYSNAGGTSDSFDFSITDGDTVIAGNTFNIIVDTNNVAPEILTTTTIYEEDFEGGTTGWNNNTTTSETTFTEFLGRFAREVDVADNQEIFQTFTLSGTQEYVTVEFDFYEIDSWDNEFFYVFVDDVLLTDSHQLRANTYNDLSTGKNGNISYTVQETSQAAGKIGFTDRFFDQTYHFSLIIPTTAATIKLGFGSNLSSNTNDESFGIDNITIQEASTAGTNNQEIFVAENAANNEKIATVLAIDPNAGQTLTYATTGGTGTGIFDINASTGEISIIDNATLDFETTTSYTLDINVTDGALSSAQTITINVLDVLENTAPTITTTGPFTISEDAAINDDVATLSATDLESDNISYSIVGGNTNNTFKINATTGLIEIRDNENLDYDSISNYNLRIRVADDNTLSLYRDRTIRIDVIDIDEAPTFNVETIIETLNPGIVYSADTGNFYQNIRTNRSFDASVAFAETQFLNGVQAHLVTITSNAEFNFIRNDVSASHIWIALSDAGEEGKWIWTEGPEAGTQISQGNEDAIGLFTNWNGSEPNSGNTRNYALMNSNGRWYDFSNDRNYNSTIEWEGKDVINNSFYNINHSTPDASDINIGDSVGYVQAFDPEGDTISFSIENGNADGIFEIDALSGEIRILDTANLDASIKDTYTLTIRATEDSASQFGEVDITIKFNDRLSISTNNALNVNEDSSAVLTTASLDITDPDNIPTDTIFRITSLPTYGQLEHSINPGFQISSFTLDDLQNGDISFVHNGAEVTTDSFEFSINDSGSISTGNTFNINIININDAPEITTNTGANVTENGRVTIDNTMLDSTDLDDTPAGLTYTATSLTRGHIEVSSVTQNTFTQDDIDNNRVEFVQDGSESANANFTFSLADGGENSAAPATGTFTLNVSGVNDAPLITTNTGANVVEGASVIITNAMLSPTDPDDSGTGLIYTLSNTINGRVELSSNAGVAIVSFTQADLDANRVRFVHDGGEADARFDVSLADGGEDSAGADSATFNLTRIPVNDSPMIGINAGSSINQNSIVIIKNSVLSASDPDDSGAGLIFTITNTTNGQLEFVNAPNVAVTTFTQDDIDNSRILFRHSRPPGTADFDFDITDGGEDSAIAASATFNLTVDNTNDAPTITTNTGPTVDEGSTTVITTSMLDSFDSDDFGEDLTWTASNLINGILQVNGVTQNTFTQADLDAGLVTFIHDDTQTTSASFDIQVADGGEDGALPDTATFTMAVTPVNDGPTLIINDGTPNVVNFNNYTIDKFDNSQDGSGGRFTGTNISADGTSLTIFGNAWKKIDYSYTLTANTVLSFEFFTDDVSEIAGIGFDDNSNFNGGVFGYQLEGTQNWNGVDQSFNTYESGDGWVRFDIPIGQDFVGVMNKLVFILDKDSGAQGNSATFRNINFYENNAVIAVNEGESVTITSAYLNSADLDDSATGLNFTASNILNGHIEVGGVTQNTFTQDDINNNRVAFVHDGSDTLTANFDISLIDGAEDGVNADTGNFTLVVNPLNDAPTIATNTGANMAEGASLTLTTAMLNEGDSDDDGANLTYTASALTNGHIEVGGVIKTTFTQDDIDKGRVAFIHDGSETTTASLALSLADGGENGATADTATFNITVNPVNDAPIIVVNTGATLLEGGATTLSNTILNATDVDSTNSNLIYTLSALAAGTIENINTAASLTIGDSFTQNDIDNSYIRYTHNGEEHTSQQFSFTLSDGTATLPPNNFDFVITPVNDAPYDLGLTAMDIDENSNIGTNIGNLYALDVDLPGDSFSFSIMSDPDNKFAITGNQLRLNGELDFETARTHSVIIRADDGNGGTIDRTMTINVRDLNETPFIALDQDNTNRNDNNAFAIEEERRNLRNTSGIMQAFLSGNKFMQMDAFYGENAVNQILRENTTSEIYNMINNNNNGFETGSSAELIEDETLFENDNNTLTQDTDNDRYTNMREMFKMIETYDDLQSEDDSNHEFQNLYTQFEDVLTYQEKRMEKLRQALQS